MNLTLTIVHNTKKTNKLYYTGDDLYNVRVAPPPATLCSVRGRIKTSPSSYETKPPVSRCKIEVIVN